MDRESLHTKVKVVGVEEELRKVEELRDELLDVGHVVLGGGGPRVLHAVEHAVCKVKMAALKHAQTNAAFISATLHQVVSNHIMRNKVDAALYVTKTTT